MNNRGDAYGEIAPYGFVMAWLEYADEGGAGDYVPPVEAAMSTRPLHTLCARQRARRHTRRRLASKRQRC